ncbi:MAG: hypothetical protein P4L87_13520 [Formivibrio sp.]|nr:hypothetical protein [Formivibrio sp.]
MNLDIPLLFRKSYRCSVRTHALAKGIEEVRKCVFKALASTAVDAESRAYAIDVQEVTLKNFIDIPGYRVTVDVESAFFPKNLQSTDRISGLGRMRSAFLLGDVVLPPYYQMGFLSPAAAAIEKASNPEDREALTSELLKSMYNESGIANLCLGVFKKKRAMAAFYGYIVESVEAHVLGMHRAAILALIPCIEGIIRNIGADIGKDIPDEISKMDFISVLTEVQKRDIRETFQSYNWVPDELISIPIFDRFHERVQMLESIKFFIDSSLYLDTRHYKNATGLNRHGIVHGFITEFASEANYLRLFTLLSALSVVCILTGDNGSLFFPAATPESEAWASRLSNLKRG